MSALESSLPDTAAPVTEPEAAPAKAARPRTERPAAAARAKPSGPTPAYRWQVFSRVVAAAVLGYVAATAISVICAVLWPVTQAEGVLAASMLSFTWYVVAVIWAFSTRSATRAWIGLGVVSVVSSAVALLLVRGLA